MIYTNKTYKLKNILQIINILALIKKVIFDLKKYLSKYKSILNVFKLTKNIFYYRNEFK